MKLFRKDGMIQFLNKIVIVKDDMQILNPTEEMVIEDGWVEYIKTVNIPTETIEDRLNTFRQEMISKILEYDSSDEVNMFYINDIPVWLDKATRTGLVLRFDAEKAKGKTETALWYNGIQFPLNIDVAIQILFAIELYASECYDNTQQHIANVQALETIEEVDNYDYRTGYPEKLRF